MDRHYILNGRTAVPVSAGEWATWLEKNHESRVVKVSEQGDIKVSTVFLGLDHSFGEGPPMIFETLVFGGVMDQDMDRYSTWDEAEAGHKEMCRKVFEKRVVRRMTLAKHKLEKDLTNSE